MLCPDCTVPVARLTATRLKGIPLPLRLYYNHNIYRGFPERKSKSVEINQVGIELIRGSSWRSDLEVVELPSRESLDKISGGKYRLELCHIGYFKAIMGSLDTDEETKEEIRLLIEQKNYASLTDILGKAQERILIPLRKLPGLFGGEEVFEKAYELFDENGAKESLDYLKEIYEYLCRLGLSDKVIIDLGLVNLAEYYTGIIFRGYFDGVGEQVLSGDGMIHFWGNLEKIKALLDLELMWIWLSQMVKTEPEKVPEILVFAKDIQAIPNSVHYRKALEKQGKTVENSVFDTLEETLSYARKKGILKVHLVGEEIMEYELGKGTDADEDN